MTTRELECVILKRRGAEYVAQLLSGKSKREELEFWDKRTESLRSRKKSEQSGSGQDTPWQGAALDGDSATLHCYLTPDRPSLVAIYLTIIFPFAIRCTTEAR